MNQVYVPGLRLNEMEKHFKNVTILSAIILFFGCQPSTSKAVTVITGLKDVSKITIIAYKNREEVVKEIKDPTEIKDFIDMFNPAPNSKAPNITKMPTPRELDGRVDIYHQNKMLSIYLRLDCCYKFNLDSTAYREKFTYRLGTYLSTLLLRK